MMQIVRGGGVNVWSVLKKQNKNLPLPWSSLSLCPRTHKIVFLPPHPSNTLVFLWFCALKIISIFLNISKRKLALQKLRAIVVVYIYSSVLNKNPGLQEHFPGCVNSAPVSYFMFAWMIVWPRLFLSYFRNLPSLLIRPVLNHQPRWLFNTV